MGSECSKRLKQTEVFSPEDSLKAFEAYEKHMAKLAAMPPATIDD